MDITVDELLEFNPPSIYTDEEARKIAAQALQIALGLVESYCRGRHTNMAGNFRPGVRSVVLTVAARIMENPGQIQKRDQAGAASYLRGEGFKGFTLGEQICLNRYRKQAI